MVCILHFNELQNNVVYMWTKHQNASAEMQRKKKNMMLVLCDSPECVFFLLRFQCVRLWFSGVEKFKCNVTSTFIFSASDFEDIFTLGVELRNTCKVTGNASGIILAMGSSNSFDLKMTFFTRKVASATVVV